MRHSRFTKPLTPSRHHASTRPSLSTAATTIMTALGLAVATPASAQTVLHACYVPASGTVYRIKATNTPQNCLQPTHVAFSWTDGADAVAALQNAVKKTDIAAGDVTGVFSSLTVGKLLGRALATTPPTEGQVLAWNATTSTWEPKTVAAGGGGGVSDHGALTGLDDDDHKSYLYVGGQRSGPGFAMVGQLNNNTSPTLTATGGAYGGFLVHTAKGAVRAGQTDIDAEWVPSQMGLGSASFGLGHIAAGEASFAAGRNNRAEGSYAAAFGYNVQANGLASFAAGQNAFASGQASLAFGYNTSATATGAVAIGGGAEASGVSSVSVFGSSLGLRAFSLFGTANSTRGVALGHRAHTNGKSDAMVIALGHSDVGIVNAAVDAQFVVSAPHIFLGHLAPPVATVGRFIETGPGAYLSSGGVWTNVSDSTKKAHFRAVDSEQVLTTLATLPVYTWSYTAEDSTTRHMGPTAQAFRAAFGLGDTDKAISTVDIDGVSLAGVKALESRTRTLKTEVLALREENAALAARLVRMEALLEASRVRVP